MQKNEKGVTLVALAITIIVLMILSSVGISIGLDSVRKSKYYSAIAQMKVMQAKVNELYEDYQGRIGNVYGEPITNTEKSEKAKDAYNIVKAQNLTESDIGEFEDYRFFSIDYIKNTLDIDGIDFDFIINIEARAVILVDGVKFDNKEYYALCQIEGERYNVEYLRETEYAGTGLILHYDAIKNTETGHDGTANKWVDISKNGKDAILTGFENTPESGWTKDGLVCNGENNYFKTANVNFEQNASLTVSVTFTENKYVVCKDTNYIILEANNGWNAFQFHTWYNNKTEKKLDGKIFIGGNYYYTLPGGEDANRFKPSELNEFRTQEGKTDNITYTYEAATKQACVYINGKLIANKTYLNESETKPIKFFQSGKGNYKTYHSILIYNRPLTPYEVQKNYEVENKKYGIQ